MANDKEPTRKSKIFNGNILSAYLILDARRKWGKLLETYKFRMSFYTVFTHGLVAVMTLELRILTAVRATMSHLFLVH